MTKVPLDPTAVTRSNDLPHSALSVQGGEKVAPGANVALRDPNWHLRLPTPLARRTFAPRKCSTCKRGIAPLGYKQCLRCQEQVKARVYALRLRRGELRRDLVIVCPGCAGLVEMGKRGRLARYCPGCGTELPT